MLRLAEVYLHRRRALARAGCRGRESHHPDAADNSITRSTAVDCETSPRIRPPTQEEAERLRRFLLSLRWYPHLSFYRTPLRDFEKQRKSLDIPEKRLEELFSEFSIEEVGTWVQIPVSSWERIKKLSEVFRSSAAGDEGSQAPLLTRENLRRCLRALTKLQGEFGDASLQEVAEALELSRAKALALLEVLKREGKVYEAKPGKWRVVV
jgi:biotin operon repressor